MKDSSYRPWGRRGALALAAVLIVVSALLGGGSAKADRATSAGGSADVHAEATGTGPLANFEARDGNLIRLLAGAFDPRSDSLPTVSGMAFRPAATLPGGQAQYWLVQVRDQRFADAVEAVRRAGGQIAGVVPDDTYMVRATPAQRSALAASPAVRWTGYYQPAWRIPAAAGGKAGLLELSGSRHYRVHVFGVDPAPGSVGRALANMDGVEVLRDEGVVVDIEATAAQIPAIAALPAVEWIGITPKAVPLNSNARWVNDTGVRDLYAATAPGRLNGAGQTAAVADTGLNYTYDLNDRAHIGFRDCNPDGTGCKQAIYTSTGSSAPEINAITNNATGHRKMVAYFDLGETGPNMFDESSHGSHTAGSVDGDQPPYNAYTGADGLAPAAKHVHQNIADSGGGLGGLPADDYDLWRQAYRPRNPVSVLETSGATGNPGDYVSPGYVPLEDARTHNNSYGLIAPVIDEGSAVRLDRFVWDHEDMTIVVSAGNAGPDPFSIGSPSVAKNELSSGASANGRQPMVSIDSMASFSSHGPTGDLRFGVDLATPGQIVVSAKGGSTDGYHTAQGTSMSGPILTGLATLVRQYFYDGFAAAGGDGFAAGTRSTSRRHNPSAALVKAALLNGAARMRGRYTGDDGNNAALDGQWPSAGQGYGRVDLDNSLYFANDPTKTWYADVYRGDTANPNASLRPFPVSGTSATRAFQMRVGPGQPLDVTLAWTDAPNLAPGGTPALVNNLDLTVTGPGGTYVGNNMNSRLSPAVNVAQTVPGAALPDISNLSERVRIAEPATGTYTITVTAPAILFGNQGFALAASGRISPVGSPLFTPGPPRQANQPGNPTISNVRIDTVSSNTAKAYFDTNEPTTATAQVVINGTPTTFVDSYNVGPGGFPGLDEAPTSIETSADYADRPVVGTKHEILITGLAPGQAADVTLRATDLANNQVSQVASLTSPTGVYQSDADDTGQLYEDPVTAAQVGQWRTGTQLYASDAGDGAAILGAFMFRLPATFDPNTIVGAAVELTSAHNWVVPYTDDRQLNVDLLDPIVEPNWGTQNYNQIKNAQRDARVYPETTYRRGDYHKYAFTFTCADLSALKATLTEAGERKAAFRYESSVDAAAGFFAMEFGFNRRSRGPTERPKLILFTGQSGYPDGRPCDPATPAPTISEVGIHEGVTPNAVTVTWETNVPSDSMVLFREDGTTPWIQVGTPALTRIHQVEVLGLDPSKEYEFVVRSRACNGATTTDTNGGAGYDFFRGGDLGPPTTHGSTFDFETDAEGWTVQTTTSPVPPNSSWIRGAFGANSSANGWHVRVNPPGSANSYSDEDETSLTSPTPGVTFTGLTAAVRFFMARDLEATFDFVHVEHSTNGLTWTTAESIDGTNPEYYPLGDYESSPREVRFANPGGPVQLRFRFKSDQLLSSPLFLGASIDQVQFLSYPNAEGGDAEDLPLTGPAPPPSAEETGLSPPATRTGAANGADIAAGTGIYCAVVPPAQRPDLQVTKIDIVNNRPHDDDEDFDNDGQHDDNDDDDDNDGHSDDDDDDDDNDRRRDGHARQSDKVTITATIANTGTAAAGASKTDFYVDGVRIRRVDTGQIPAGGTRKVSIVWDTRNEEPGPHVIEVRADGTNQVMESNENNNSRTQIYTVQPNNAENGSFEDDDDGNSGPDHWSSSSTGAGTALWSNGGSHGAKSVSLNGNGGNAALYGSPAWTSAPIAVAPGRLMDLQLSVAASGLSSPASARLVYLDTLGNVLDTVTLITPPLSTQGFVTLEQSVTIPVGVARVRVVLTAFASTDVSTAGTATFDDVGLFER